MGHILVTDDDQTCRDSIRRVLEREGHTVQTADSVDGAVTALDRQRFDLVLCDYRMPGKTGLELLAELKRRRAPVPVLMMSAYADPLVEQSILHLGALELMKKPLRRRELVDRAARITGGR